MDELLKNALGCILESKDISDKEKLEVIGAIHTLYRYVDILEEL